MPYTSLLPYAVFSSPAMGSTPTETLPSSFEGYCLMSSHSPA